MTTRRTHRRHVKASATRKMAGRRYEIHHNGSRPFAITVSPAKKELTVEDATGHVVTTKKYKQIWLGSGRIPNVGGDKGLGHSALAELPTGEFLFVGQRVLTFRLQRGDKPVKYVSYISNNDVVYAYLVGTHNTYMLLESEVVPNEFLDAKKDAYGQYYGALPGPRGPVKTHAKKYAVRVLAQAD